MKKTLLTVLLSLAFLFIFSGKSHAQDFVTFGLTAQAAACPTNPGNTSTSTSAVTIDTLNYGGASFTIGSTTFSGTVSFFGSGDGGTTWQPLNVFPSNSTTPVTTATATGLWQANVSAYTKVCMLATTFSSGTITVTIRKATVSARAGGGGGGSGLPTGPTSPNGVPQVLTSTPSGGVAGAATYGLAGVPVNNNSETTCATQTLNVLDRATAIFCSGGTTSTFTLPVHTTSGFGANFPFILLNLNSGAMTLSPTTDTIDTATLFPNWGDHLYNNASGNWQSAQFPLFAAFPNCTDSSGNHLNFTVSTGVFSCGTSSSGGGAAVYASPLTSTTKQWEEFLRPVNSGNTVEQTNWTSGGLGLGIVRTQSGSDTAAVTTPTAAEPLTELALTSGAVSGNYDGWTTGASPGLWVFGATTQDFEAVTKISTISTIRACLFVLDTNNTNHCLNNDTFAAAGVGDSAVGFQFSTNRSDTHIQLIVGNGTTQTTCDSGVTPDTTSHRYEIVLAASAATFYIDGVNVTGACSMTNFPASSTRMGFLVGAETLTTAGVTISSGGIHALLATAH